MIELKETILNCLSKQKTCMSSVCSRLAFEFSVVTYVTIQ